MENCGSPVSLDRFDDEVFAYLSLRVWGRWIGLVGIKGGFLEHVRCWRWRMGCIDFCKGVYDSIMFAYAAPSDLQIIVQNNIKDSTQSKSQPNPNFFLSISPCHPSLSKSPILFFPSNFFTKCMQPKGYLWHYLYGILCVYVKILII